MYEKDLKVDFWWLQLMYEGLKKNLKVLIMIWDLHEYLLVAVKMELHLEMFFFVKLIELLSCKC